MRMRSAREVYLLRKSKQAEGFRETSLDLVIEGGS